MFDDDEEPPEAKVLPDIPDSTPDIPDSTPDIPDPSNASPELRRTFIRLVLIFNVALLATAVGLMLIGFEGRWRRGGALVGVGLAAFALGYRRYRNRPDFE